MGPFLWPDSRSQGWLCGLRHCRGATSSHRRCPIGHDWPFASSPSRKIWRSQLFQVEQNRGGYVSRCQIKKNNKFRLDPRFAHSSLVGAKGRRRVPLSRLFLRFGVTFKRPSLSGNTCPNLPGTSRFGAIFDPPLTLWRPSSLSASTDRS